MQKLFAVLVLMLFVMSIMPVALAEDVDSEQVDVDEVDDSTEEVEDSDDGSENEVEEEIEVRERDGRTRVKQKIRKEIREDRSLEKSKIRVEHARKRFHEAKEHYVEARERFQEHKGNLAELRENIKECRESEDCEVHKKGLRKGVRNHLIKTGDLIERSLEKLSAKIEGSDLLEEEKTAALAKLAELEVKLTESNEAVKALAEEEVTNDELRNAIKDLREVWKEVRKEQRAIVSSLMNSRLENVITEKLPEFDEAMTNRIAEISELGGDVTSLEEKQAQYLAELESLQTAQDEAEEIWTSFRTGDVSIEEWREAHDKVREGLKEVKETIREFMKEYRDAKKDLAGSDDVDEEETTEE